MDPMDPMDPPSSPPWQKSAWSIAAQEAFEQSLVHVARIHEQQVFELQGEIASLRQQLEEVSALPQQADVTREPTSDGADEESLHDEVALWVRQEFNRTMATPVKPGAGGGPNGVNGMPTEAGHNSKQSEAVIRESDVTFSVALAVAAEVRAERDDDFEEGQVECLPTPPPASTNVGVMSPTVDRSSQKLKEDRQAQKNLRNTTESTISSLSAIAERLAGGQEFSGSYESEKQYLQHIYRSPSEPPLPEDVLDDTVVMDRWVRMVDGVLRVAKEKKLYELRDPWIQQDWFLAKQMRQQENLDLFHPKNVQERNTSANRRPTAIIVEQIKTVHSDNFRCQRLVLDPQSPKRIFWMSIGMVLMIYDLFILPMQAFPLPNGWFLRWMQWFGQIFWTLDVGVSFMTGVYIHSELVMSPATIARVYASTWLIFDLLVVVPLWVVEFLGIESGAEKSTSLFKYVRMLRFLRLARLAKFEHYLQEALATVNSSALLLCFGMFKQMSSLIILNHINACIWYAVGKHGTGGWVEAYDDTPLIYRYLTSMHWTLTQFQGTSEVVPTVGQGREVLERAHAVVTVMFALIILAFFVSRLTNMMLQLQQLREERTGMQRAVRAYLCANNISLQLSVRVKKYIDWKQNMQTKGRSSEVLVQLPIGLQMDLQEEVRSPLIIGHPLFAAFRTTHLRFFRMLCFEGLRPLSPAPRELLFIPNDACHQMYFIISGTFRYFSSAIGALTLKQQMIEEALMSKDVHERDDIVQLGSGAWFSEPALWTHWDHRGGCMGVNDSTLLTLVDSDFAKIIRSHGPAHASGVLYARLFVAGLNRFGKNYDDLVDSEILIHEMHDDKIDERTSFLESHSIR